MTLNETQKEKIKRFIGDKVISDAVYDILLAFFLKKNPTSDIHLLAASRLSVDFLADGWKELNKISQEEESVDKQVLTPHV